MTAYNGNPQYGFYETEKPSTSANFQQTYKGRADEKDILRVFRAAALEHHRRQIVFSRVVTVLGIAACVASLMLRRTDYHPAMVFVAGIAATGLSIRYTNEQRAALLTAKKLSDESYANYLTEIKDPGNKAIYRIAERRLQKYMTPTGV